MVLWAGVIKFLGSPGKWGPGVPILPVIWGPPRENGDPLCVVSIRLSTCSQETDTSSRRHLEVLSCSLTESRYFSVMDNLTEPTRGTPTDGRFTYNQLHVYLRDGSYPESYTMANKAALRKRAKFFTSEGSDLFYVGGPPSKLEQEL